MNKIEKFEDNCIIVKIPISIYCKDNVYEATRRCWRAKKSRAEKADYVLGTVDGKVECVLKITGCDYVKSEFCKKEMQKCKRDFNVNIELCKNRRRLEFTGTELKNDKKYLNKELPEEYIPKQFPVRYTY
ncbi:MAG: hypothetical protein FWC10_09460 [Lentimicrobiaceae bacterium]|nr:hypothetical protein [Lentimicrobiaceae bacterium]